MQCPQRHTKVSAGQLPRGRVVCLRGMASSSAVTRHQRNALPPFLYLFLSLFLSPFPAGSPLRWTLRIQLSPLTSCPSLAVGEGTGKNQQKYKKNQKRKTEKRSGGMRREGFLLPSGSAGPDRPPIRPLLMQGSGGSRPRLLLLNSICLIFSHSSSTADGYGAPGGPTCPPGVFSVQQPPFASSLWVLLHWCTATVTVSLLFF